MATGGPISLGSTTEIFDFLTERGVLSGVYIAFLLYPLVAYSPSLRSGLPTGTPLMAGILILGLILSKITYEFLLGVSRCATENKVLEGFREMVEDSETISYTEFRITRATILASSTTDGAYFREQILKHESLRNTITYLMCSNLLAFFILLPLGVFSWLAPRLVSVPLHTVVAELFLVAYVLIATLIGNRARSVTLGRSVGLAHRVSRNHA